MTTKELPIHFADNFWESLEKNGITILIERMRGAKQTCERFKHAYESRALLEEEYGKTLLQISQKQKTSSTENGSSKNAMDTMQIQFQSVAESHLQLSDHLRENVAVPLGKLLSKQRMLRKELQASIQKLYNNRQIQVHFVRRAHKRHNLEIEKANLLVQQQVSEKDKRAVFKTAETTIDKLKKVYEEALSDLSKIVENWNVEWRHTCESFEKLEQERLEFFKSNLSNCANLMIGCLEGEIQAYEKINEEAVKIDVVQDIVQFVNLNKSSDVIPTPMEYIKLHAYHEANQDRGDLKYTHNVIRDTMDNEDHSESEDRVHVHINRKRSSTITSMVSDNKSVEKKLPEQNYVDISRKQVNTTSISTSPVTHVPDVEAPVMMVGVMEVYASGEDDDTEDEEYEYVTETESEAEEETVQELDVKDNVKENFVQVEPQQPAQEMIENEEASSHVEENAVEDQEVNEEPAPVAPPRATIRPVYSQESSQASVPQDEKVGRLMSAYQQEIQKERITATQQPQPSMLVSKFNGFNPKRRVSFVETGSQVLKDIPTQSVSTTVPPSNLERFDSNYSNRSGLDTEEDEDYSRASDEAAFELDDMLRELDSKRIIRDGAEDSVRYGQPDIKPTASISSPSLLQKQQQRRSHIPSSHYFSSQKQKSNRRMSTIESPSYSRQSSYSTMSSTPGSIDIYDPFNSYSSKETSADTINNVPTHYANTDSTRSKVNNSPPSAQMIHDRMLNNQPEKSQHRRTASSSSSPTASLRSVEQPNPGNKLVQDFYSGSSKLSAPDSTVQKRTNAGKFIDFALALYDYEEADEGEISFKEGDLLGIISKSDEDDEQGWWEASLLNKRNQRVIRTGLVPSNFLETVSK